MDILIELPGELIETLKRNPGYENSFNEIFGDKIINGNNIKLNTLIKRFNNSTTISKISKELLKDNSDFDDVCYERLGTSNDINKYSTDKNSRFNNKENSDIIYNTFMVMMRSNIEQPLIFLDLIISVLKITKDESQKKTRYSQYPYPYHTFNKLFQKLIDLSNYCINHPNNKFDIAFQKKFKNLPNKQEQIELLLNEIERNNSGNSYLTNKELRKYPDINKPPIKGKADFRFIKGDSYDSHTMYQIFNGLKNEGFIKCDKDIFFNLWDDGEAVRWYGSIPDLYLLLVLLEKRELIKIPNLLGNRKEPVIIESGNQFKNESGFNILKVSYNVSKYYDYIHKDNLQYLKTGALKEIREIFQNLE
jgi:hypothetical protein